MMNNESRRRLLLHAASTITTTTTSSSSSSSSKSSIGTRCIVNCSVSSGSSSNSSNSNSSSRSRSSSSSCTSSSNNSSSSSGRYGGSSRSTSHFHRPVQSWVRHHMSDGAATSSGNFTSLDRLLRFKPALVHIEREDDTEGKPDDELGADVYDSDGTVLEGRDPRLILGRRLLKLGKVNYRHIETLPEWLQAAQKDICSHRTAPQIRRCLEKWMLKSDRELQEKYKAKRLVWKREIEEGKTPTVITYGPEETVAYAHYFLPSRFALTKRVLQEVKVLLPHFQPKRVLDFGCGPATVGAAVAEVWPTTDQDACFEKYTGVDISRSMLDAAKSVMNKVKETHGTDSVFWDKSAEVVRRAELKGERYDLVVASYSLVELSSDAARRAATQLLFELVDVGGLLVVVESGNPQGSHAVRTARQLVLDSFNGPPEGAGETKKWTRKRAAMQQQHQQLGTPQSQSQSQSQNKDKVSDVHIKPLRLQPVLPAPGGWSHEDIGAFTISPCTHDKPCPLTRGAWCSFSQRVHSGMIRKASEEKFSYAVMQKRVVGEVSLATGRAHGKSSMWNKPGKEHLADEWISPDVTGAAGGAGLGGGNRSTAVADGGRDPTPLRVLERFMDADEDALPGLVDELVDQVDWEEYRPPLYRSEWGRVLRSPLKATGHVTLDLCLPSGEVARNVLSKSNVVHVPSLYTALRKTTWGGLFPVMQGDTFRSPLAVERKGVGQSPFLAAPPLSKEEEERRKEVGRRRGLPQASGSAGGVGYSNHAPASASASATGRASSLTPRRSPSSSPSLSVPASASAGASGRPPTPSGRPSASSPSRARSASAQAPERAVTRAAAAEVEPATRGRVRPRVSGISRRRLRPMDDDDA